MHSVLAKMRDAYRPIAVPNDDAHMVLKGWGSAIRAKFDTDNLHLTGREMHTMSEKVLAVVQQLGATVGRLQAQVSELSSRMASFEQVHVASMCRIEDGLLALGGGATSAGGATSGGATSGGATSGGATSSGATRTVAAGDSSSRPQVGTPVGAGLDRRHIAGSAQQEEYALSRLHGGAFYWTAWTTLATCRSTSPTTGYSYPYPYP